jgi:anaerobic ribonucleoside-triphosphate reductase activating protein
MTEVLPIQSMQVMQIAQVVPCTEAEGPGKRFAIWFQGCPLRCPGCCNPEFLSFHGGQPISIDEMADRISRTREENGIEGVTFLGGEPFAHADTAATLARLIRDQGLSVMVFSGYTIEELRARPEPEVAQLITHTDILVDGPYDRDRPDNERRWIGSTNQRIDGNPKRQCSRQSQPGQQPETGYSRAQDSA